MPDDSNADLVENQFFRPLPNKEAEALAEHMYDRWRSHEAVAAEWVNYIPRKWEELEPDIQRGYRAIALDHLSWSNARRDAAVAEAKFAPIGDNHHNAAACPYCSPSPDPRDAQIARLTEILKRVDHYALVIDSAVRHSDPAHKKAVSEVIFSIRAALAQEDGR